MSIPGHAFTREQIQEAIRRAFIDSTDEEFLAALYKHNPHLLDGK